VVSRLAAAIAAASATRNDLAATGGAKLIGFGATTVDGALGTQAKGIADNAKAIADLDTAKLAKAGGTMTGPLALSGAPSTDLHAANKAYVDGMAPKSGFQEFTTTGTFPIPAGARFVYVEAVGGGAGGNWTSMSPSNGGGNYVGSGGFGADFNSKLFRAVDLPASLTVTIGMGGTAGNSSTPAGGIGGDSKFGDLLIARGGRAGITSFYTTTPNLRNSTTGGQNGGYLNSATGSTVGASDAGASQKGGGGGAGGRSYAGAVYQLPGGISDESGWGGDGNASTQAQADGKFPGGGGGGCSGGAYVGKGGNGRVRIWWW